MYLTPKEEAAATVLCGVGCWRHYLYGCVLA